MLEKGSFFGDAIVRSNVGNLHPLEIAVGLEEFAPIRRQILKAFGNKRRRSKDLTEFREKREARGYRYSKPGLLALFIGAHMGSLLKGIYQEGIGEDIDRRRLATLFAYDVRVGMLGVLGAIGGAEKEIKGEIDESINQYILKVDDLLPSRSIIDRVGEYLYEKSKSLKHAELLKIDPTGFQLVDTTLQDLREEIAQFENYPFCKEFVLVGGELARDVYKILYRITEEPNSSTPKLP